MKKIYLTLPQIKAELDKCLQCANKPCMNACPTLCSPCDFIKAAKSGDWKKAANLIEHQNPLGEVCGIVCPDKFCMRSCLRAKIDNAIKIPQVQSYIMKKAREDKNSLFIDVCTNNKKIAVVGFGPAGLGATFELIKNGYQVDVFEKEKDFGGAVNLIPKERLPKEVIHFEWNKIINNTLVNFYPETEVNNWNELLEKYDGIIIAVGEQNLRSLGIDGENYCVSYIDYLKNSDKYVSLDNVAVIGGGAVAVDCAITAKNKGAKNVEMFVRRKISDMRITSNERQDLLDAQIDITTMTRVVKIEKKLNKLNIHTVKTHFNDDGKLVDSDNSLIIRSDFSLVILAMGSYAETLICESDRIVLAGDCTGKAGTVVEALASGKYAANKLMLNIRA